MEASIKDGNIKTFVKLLQCASKFGDDLNISANKDLWELSVTNSSKSAFCLFKLQKSFFCRYKALGTSVEQRRGVKCQLLVKSALSVLGKASPSSNVERVDLKIYDPENSLRSKRKRARASEGDGNTTTEEGSDDELSRGIEAYLVMKLVCRHGVTKRHSLHLGTTEFLRADVDPDTTPSGFLVPARTLRTWLDHFHIGLTSSSISTSGGSTTIRQENQLSWMFSRDEVRVKSWEGGTKELSTEIKVKKDDFEDYEVFNGRVDLTLPMREFRATLALADQLSIRLVVAFSVASQPLTLTSDPNDADQDETPDIFCAIATTTCDQFLTVRTPSDPQTDSAQGRANSASGSTTSFLQRNNSRYRDTVGEERNVRPRLSSEQPSKRGKLSMSSQPSRVPNSVPTTTNRTSGRPSSTQNGNQSDHGENGGVEPLFMPHESQYHEDNSQVPQLSQAEVEAISGLGDMEDVFDAMDDLQHEEEVEELRASQRVAQEENEEQEPPQHPASASAKTREPLAERPLELDTSIVGPVATTTAAVNEGDTTTREEGGTEEGDETRQADFEVHEGEDNQEHRGEDNEEREDMSNREVEAPGPRAEDTTAEQEEDEIESDEDIPATQKPSHEVDGFEQFFED